MASVGKNVGDAESSPFNRVPGDVMAIIVRRLLPSPAGVLSLPVAAKPCEADLCWREYRKQIRIARNTLLNLRLVSKLFREAVTRDDLLWYRLCLGLYPKFTTRSAGYICYEELERLRIENSRKEFRGFGRGHERWRASPEGRALAVKIEIASDAQRSIFLATEPPVLHQPWFVLLQQRAASPLQCMQCGESFREVSNVSDACRYHSAGSGCVFDFDEDDFITAPHTCCSRPEGCMQGFHDAEDGIFSPDWEQRSYDTAHM